MEEEKKVQEPEIVETTETKVESKGLSITAMILGIVSIVLCCNFYCSVPCSILAIVFGIIGKKKGGAGFAKTGLVLGIIALALTILVYALFASLIATIFAAIF